MSSRAHILGRIKARLHRSAVDEVQAQARLDAYSSARMRGPAPAAESDLAAAFAARSVALSSTIARVASEADVPDAVARYLVRQGLRLRIVCWPQLAALPWRTAGIAAEDRPAASDDLVGITGCFCAVAETGTLVLCSGDRHHATTSLLPETHIAVLAAARIVPTMEDAFELVRGELHDWPRAINFVSGPSRTGDIEQTIVLGAHGPYRVHVIIVGGR